MGGAERVDSGAHGDVVPLDWAVVGDGQGDAALAGHAEVADAGERAERADMDILARPDDDGPEGGVTRSRAARRRRAGRAAKTEGSTGSGGDGSVVSFSWLIAPWLWLLPWYPMSRSKKLNGRARTVFGGGYRKRQGNRRRAVQVHYSHLLRPMTIVRFAQRDFAASAGSANRDSPTQGLPKILLAT